MWKELLQVWRSDNLLKQAYDQSYEMLRIDQEMFGKAVESLRHTDVDVDIETRKKDKIVNSYEREVRRKVLTHLTVQGVTDVPAGLVLITIIIDIERIGDYTKNIMDLASLHIPRLQGSQFEEHLVKIEKAVEELFMKTLDCLKMSDPDAALDIMNENKWIGKECDQHIAELIKTDIPSLSMTNAVTLALYFRYLKRINAHLRNIASSVVNPFDRIGYKYKAPKE